MAAEGAGVGGESGKKILTFHLTVWASRAFPLHRSPRLPPSAPGSACDHRAQKRAEPADFGVLGARLGRFFDTGTEKVVWGACWGRGWRCSNK